eukprot:571859-Pleurochrysis_carterae.AAC.2
MLMLMRTRNADADAYMHEYVSVQRGHFLPVLSVLRVTLVVHVRKPARARQVRRLQRRLRRGSSEGKERKGRVECERRFTVKVRNIAFESL